MSAVALVVVSHSDLLARGVVELSGAMAPDVHIGAAGGLPDGGLGTSFDLVEEAVGKALDAAGGAGVVVLTDLGSATLTVDMVIEFADDPDAVRLVDGPLVEGAVAAAVAAQQGQDQDGVAQAMKDAASQWCPEESAPAKLKKLKSDALEEPPADELPVGTEVTLEALVTDPAGMHARPAAQIAALAATFDAEVTIDDAGAESMMELMSLGVAKGDTVVVSATGADAVSAAHAIADAITHGVAEPSADA